MPQTTKGNPVNDVINSAPEIAGLIADARLRGTAVTLAATGLSAGVTTAMHFWANDDAIRLAKGLRAALDKTARAKS